MRIVSVPEIYRLQVQCAQSFWIYDLKYGYCWKDYYFHKSHWNGAFRVYAYAYVYCHHFWADHRHLNTLYTESKTTFETRFRWDLRNFNMKCKKKGCSLKTFPHFCSKCQIHIFKLNYSTNRFNLLCETSAYAQNFKWICI